MAESSSADWYPDPNDSSRLRYWDGGAWTVYTAPRWPGPNPVGHNTPPVAALRDGRLRVAGVMHLITGGLLVLPVLALVIVGGEGILWLIVAIPIFGAGTAVHAVIGVGCVRGRSWARIASIVLGAVLLAITLPSWSANPIFGVIALVWLGTIVGLSIAADRRSARPVGAATPREGERHTI